MTIRPSRYPVIAIAFVAACSSNSPDQTTTPPAATFTVGPHDIWAGSTVTIRSSAFHGAIDTTGVAQFNGTSLVLHRVDDTTVSVDLPPSTMAGSYPLSLQFAAVVKTLDPITVYGYADSTSYPIQNDWDTYAWPRGTPHAMVMGTNDGDVIHLVDLDTHAVTLISGLSSHGANTGLDSPGFTYADDNALVVQPATPSSPPSYALIHAVSPPVFIPQLGLNVGLDGPPHQLLKLGPTTWFAAGKSGSVVVTNVDSTDPFSAGTITPLPTGGDAWGVYMSPRHDRATYAPDHIVAGAGVPVLAMPSGNVAFAVPMPIGASSADFSADGSLLAMTGGSQAREGFFGRLMVVSANDGTMQHDTTFSTNTYLASFDPVRPLLYVWTLVTDLGSSVLKSEVVVLDRGTFRVVGRMETPQNSAATCNTNFSGALSVSSSGNALYAFRGCYTTPSVALRFTLPSDSGIQ
ncbi:MAG TPA: hypothetical protein VGM20_05405 [Gemmatimonadales bacterium]|jgi:hypothetical protein